MDAAPIRRRVVVYGRVQGVFFRDSVRERARAANLAGWVRNCPDGTLETVLEGSPEAVRRLIAFCHTGPPRARVDHVEVQEQGPEGLAGFQVR